MSEKYGGARDRAPALASTAAEEACSPYGDTAASSLDPGVSGDRKRARTFGVGTCVAERYHVERFIAAGGMGEVYAAFDLALRQRVALKTLRREREGDPRTLERFRREAAYARRVTHPCVARLFDIGTHEGPEGTTTFLTMELLDGESLADRIARVGRLPLDEVRAVASDVCDALDAAHRQGIVHRDLKSSNVVLVTRPDGATRAVITDFGLARALDDALEARRLSVDGALLGTPAYMAPEQVTGSADVGPPADIYALGVMLFEMLTGALPFEGASAMTTALMRVSQDAPALERVCADIGAGPSAVVARCLRRDVAERFPTAGAVARALREEEAPASPDAVARRSKRRGRAFAAALAVCAVAGGGVFAWQAGKGGTIALHAAPGVRPVIVVAPFVHDGNAGDAWLAGAFGELLATELAAGQTLHVIPPSDVRAGDASAIARAAADAGAQVLVRATFRGDGARADAPFTLDVTVDEVPSGRHLATTSLRGDRDDLAGLVARTADDLRRRLGQPALDAKDAAAARAILPRSLDAARAYGEALAEAGTFAFAGAIASFRRAIAADPQFALAEIGRSNAATQLGLEDEARDAAARAVTLAGDLPREMRLFAEAEQAVATKRWDVAVDRYRTLHGFFPDQVDYTRRLARSLSYAGRPEEAVAAVAAARGPGMPRADAIKLDFQEAFARSKMAAYREELAVARHAEGEARALGADGMVADALLYASGAEERLGEREAALRDARAAEGLIDPRLDPQGAATAATAMAEVLRELGRPEEAVLLTRRAVDLLRPLGDRYQTANKLTQLGITLGGLGKLAEASAAFREASPLYVAVGNVEGVAHQIENVAQMEIEQGNLAGHDEALDRAQAMHASIGMRTGVCDVQTVRALLLERRGDLAGARRELEEVRKEARALGDASLAVDASDRLAVVLSDMGEAAAAREASSDAVAQARRVEDPVALASALVHAAWIAGGESPFAASPEGLAAAEEAATLAAKAHVRDWLALAEAGHAVLAARAGTRADAASAIERAERAAEATERLEVRVRVAAACAEVAGTGVAGACRSDVADAAARADATGARGLALEAREAALRGEANRNARASRAHALARAAAAAGYVRLARFLRRF